MSEQGAVGVGWGPVAYLCSGLGQGGEMRLNLEYTLGGAGGGQTKVALREVVFKKTLRVCIKSLMTNLNQWRYLCYFQESG